MSSSERTVLSMTDDGAGQIACPLKGLMAIQRCYAWQEETEAAGRSCTCAVFHAYRGGDPAEGAAPPKNRMCGRVFDSSVEAVVNRHPDAKKEEPPMGKNNPRKPQLCGACGKESPEGTHVFNGRCKPCRDKAKPGDPAPAASPASPAAQRLEQMRTQQATTAKTIASVVEKHVPAKSRQQILPAVAEQEIARLKEEIAGKDRAISELNDRLAKVAWVAEGVRKGYAQIDQLAQVATVR